MDAGTDPRQASRAPADPETLRFEATVERGGTEVVLSKTYFYPEGGGQPADRGTVDGIAVEDVRKRDGDVIHDLAEPLEAGASVVGRVDPAFRRYCMRAHTASHVLYGAGRRLFDDLGYAGFDVGTEKVRVDLATPSDVDDEALLDLERLVGRTVWESRPVAWEQRPRDAALSDETVAFNAQTEEGIDGDTVRVVTVGGRTEGDGFGVSDRQDPWSDADDPSSEAGGASSEGDDSLGADDPWDVAACGGTHVRNTREIGPVTVLGRSNPGEGVTRVEFAVGPAGIERRLVEKRAALDAASELGTRVDDVVAEIRRLQKRVETVAAERDALRSEVVAARVADLPTVEREGTTWLVGELDLDANDLAEAARDHAGDRATVVAFVSPDGRLAVAADGSVAADDVVGDVTATFGGGGGGSPTVAQGGGLEADAAAVVEYLQG